MIRTNIFNTRSMRRLLDAQVEFITLTRIEKPLNCLKLVYIILFDGSYSHQHDMNEIAESLIPYQTTREEVSYYQGGTPDGREVSLIYLG